MKVALLCIGALLVLACSAHSPGKRNAGSGNGNTCGGGGGGDSPQCTQCTQIDADPVMPPFHQWSSGLEFEIWDIGSGSSQAVCTVGDNGPDGTSDGRIVSVQANAIIIASKSTLTRLYANRTNLFFDDIVALMNVAYDSMNKGNRFYVSLVDGAECNERLIITSGPLAGPICTSVSYFGASSFFVPSTPVVATIPFTSDVPLANAAAIKNNIALIFTTPTLFFWEQVINAQNAGATAAILIDYTQRSLFDIGGNPIVTIPIVLIQYNNGIAILNNLPLNASMNSDVPLEQNFTMHLATSKTSTPSGKSDFFFDQFNLLNGTSNYPAATFTTATNDVVYVVVQNYPAPDYFVGSQVWAFDKATLNSGGGMELLWQYDLTDVYNPVNGNRFYRPALYNTPVLFNDPYLFLVGPGDIAGANSNGCQTQISDLHIYYGNRKGLINGNNPIKIKIPQGPICYIVNDYPGLTQPGLPQHANPYPVYLASAPVISGYSMVWAIGYNITSTQYAALWFEFGLTNFAQTGNITLLQSGIIYTDAQTSIAYPNANQDKDGNILISFTMSGPNQYPTQAYVSRLRDWPLNTVAMPPIQYAPSSISFNSGQPASMQAVQSVVLDPAGKKDFYLFGTNPDRTGPYYQNTSTYSWITELAIVEVNKLSCADCPPQYANLVPTYVTPTPSHNKSAHCFIPPVRMPCRW